MLSAYELSGKRDTVLLEKSIQLGDKLVRAWETDNPMPWTYIYFDDRPIRRARVRLGSLLLRRKASSAPTPAQISVSAASLVLEFRTLSKHSGNDTYYDLAKKAQDAILSAVRRGVYP